MPRVPAPPPWQPRQEDYYRIFLEQNPWHAEGRVPDALAHRVERPLAEGLWRMLAFNSHRRYQLILGPRRVGKTTVMYQAVRHLLASGVTPGRLWWLRLDHPLLMEVPLDGIVHEILMRTGATPALPIFLFLDELTYALNWDLWLKTFYDERRPVRLVGTSSSIAALKQGRHESGVGRWEEQYLAPYLFNEYLDLAQRSIELPVGRTLAETLQHLTRQLGAFPVLEADRRRFLLTGGFPELLLDEAPGADEETRLLHSQRTLRSDAVERAIYKDIPQVFGVNDPMMLERLLYTLAAQVTGVLSPTSLCQELGMPLATFDRYLSYLERAFVVFTLPNYSGNEATTQRRGRKLYFVDGAIRNAALQRGLAPLQNTAEMGLLLENLAAGHLHALAQQTQVRLYHWREGRDEVDLLYDQPDAPVAFEIGHSPDHSRKGLLALCSRHRRFQNRCYLVAPGAPLKPAGLPDNPIGSIPFDLFLVAVGRQASAALAHRIDAESFA